MRSNFMIGAISPAAFLAWASNNGVPTELACEPDSDEDLIELPAA